MNDVLQQITGGWKQLSLVNLSLKPWGEASYVHRVIGSLRSWRQGSWFLRWADPLGAGLAIAIFVTAPFVPNNLIGLLLIACAGYWVLLTLSDDAAAGSGITPMHLLIALYWWIATVATGLSPVRSAAIEGWTKLTLYVLLFALMARVLRSPRLRSTLISVYLLVALVVSVAGMRQWIFGAAALATWVDQTSTLVGTTRVYSFLGNPNLLAAYLLPAAVFSAAAIFAWKGWIPKALAILMWGINSTCLILTFSRGGWIGFVAAGFVFVMLLVHWFSIYLPRFWQIWALPIVLGATTTLLVLAVVAIDPLRDRVASMFSGRNDSSNNFRINVWMAVIEMVKDRPVLGIGPGNDAFNQVYPKYQQAGYTALSAYSIVLEILVETGFIGLSCFLWILMVTLTQGWVQIQRLRQVASRDGFWLMAAIATMIGMLGHGMFDTVWYRPQVSTLWWLMLAIVASYYQPRVATSEQAISNQVS